LFSCHIIVRGWTPGRRNFILTIFNVFDPETFLAAVAPSAATLDPGAEEASQRLSAEGTEPDRGRRVTGRSHEVASL
jgi:hypothetical protein